MVLEIYKLVASILTQATLGMGKLLVGVYCMVGIFDMVGMVGM